MENKVYKIAILASGAGSNAKNLILDSRKDSNKVYKVELVITNNKDAGVINICRQLGVPCFLWKKDSFLSPDFLISSLKNNSIDYIILAGFLLKISDKIIENFPKKIINIHPSLLPKYGGNGMYGNKVHQAVLDNKEKESGITIHFVNEHYDEGEIISQKKISLNECAEINLSENGIETIDLIECKYTKKINLSNNLLKSLINLKNFKYLQEINLDYNEISEINDLAFDQLLKLKVISLKYNKLSKMFATKSKSIQEIHINGNNINEIGNEMANIVKK